jgi:TRAP-type C4-dicarboxylate transport system permease small subunit
MQNLLAYGNMFLADTIKLLPNDNGIGSAVQGLELGDIVGGFLRLILVIAALVFFFILVMGGINWIISGGDKAKTEGARNQITAALVGLVIVFSAWAIASLIGTFFGIEGGIFNLTLPSVGQQ